MAVESSPQGPRVVAEIKLWWVSTESGGRWPWVVAESSWQRRVRERLGGGVHEKNFFVFGYCVAWRGETQKRNALITKLFIRLFSHVCLSIRAVSSSVLATDAYSNIIILGTEEYKKIVEHIPFS
jgi:hypothetical protein